MSFGVLFPYVNYRVETIVPPGIMLLSRILKDAGFRVSVFDTTDYGLDLAHDYEKLTEASLGVRPSSHRKPKYFERDVYKDFNDSVNSFNPNLIAVSATENTFLLAVEMIKRLKYRDACEIPVVLGGPFATSASERALDFPEIDIVCVGEGETPLRELCQRMEKGKDWSDVPGLVFRNRLGKIQKNPLPPPTELDQNPTNPDLTLFDWDRFVRPMAGRLYFTVPVETARGCVYPCTFCNSRLTGVRVKSMEKVREEIFWYIENSPVPVEYLFLWADTLLLMPKESLRELCEVLKDVGLPWWGQSHVNTIDRWRLEMIKNAGIHRLSIGIEHGNQKFRMETVRKEFTDEQAVKATEFLEDAGITYNTNNIVGYPGETPELALDTVRLNRRFKKVDTTNCFTFAPYHGTPARDWAVSSGFIDPGTIAPGNAERSILRMPQFPVDDIERFRLSFALKVKFPESRWSEIDRAMYETPEALVLRNKLHQEYRETFFGEAKISF